MDWTLKTIPIKDLKEHPKNPRKIDKKQMQHLEELVERFGLIDKPIVNTDGIIIGGHQRVKILKKQKMKEVECWVPEQELSESDINDLCIGLNLNQGQFDYDILKDQWDPLDLLRLGFTEDQLMESFKDIEKIVDFDSEEDNKEFAPCKDEDAITKPGDLYELGDHRLICGDSTMPDVAQAVLQQDIPILLITDPPYGVEYDPEWRKDIKEKKGIGAKALGKVQNDDKINWSVAWSLFPGSIAYIWHAGKYCSEVQKSLEECDFEIICQIIWKKTHFVLSRGDYHWEHEPCWYAVKKGHKHNWQGSRKEKTIWEIANLGAFGKSKNEDTRTVHSTQKPLECMARPMMNNTERGDYVYDPFLGSGTTMIAAEKLGRKCLGIELSAAYCDVIVRRWIAYRKNHGNDAIVIQNGEICKEFDE